MPPTVPDGATRRARRAVAVVFAAHGAASGSFATAIPWIREHLSLTPGWLGIALVFLTVGASAAMSFSARLEHRFRPRPLLACLAAACCAGLALPALAPSLGWLCLALFFYGCGLGLLDVAMNAHGVRIEERYGRSVMSGLHGVWSVGTLLGGAGGALAAHADVPASVHLPLVAPVLAAVSAFAARWAPEADPQQLPGQQEEPPRFALPARAVLPIGVIGFCAIFAEGAAMDWSGIYLRDVTHADPAIAASAFTAFACTMAASRLAGDAAVRRLGPVRTVRISGVVAALGSALVVLARSPLPAIAGFALIGVGIAVVVPLCFAAAGRTGAGTQGQAIAGVATLAYASGLAAPAAVGWIAEATTLTVSFGMVTVLLFGVVFGAGVLRSEAKPPVGAGTAADGAERRAAPDGLGTGGS